MTDMITYKPSQVFAHTHLEGPPPDKLYCFSGGCVGEGLGEGAGMTLPFFPSQENNSVNISFSFFPMSLQHFFFLPEAVVAELGCDYNSQGHACFLGKKL